MRARLAADIGGTFTDVVLESPAGRDTAKVLTTGSPEVGVLEGIRRVLGAAGLPPSEVSVFVHGTTLATNALIERKGARTAFVTTEGMRDILEMGYEKRFEQYDVYMERPLPLVPRPLRCTVPGRRDGRGRVLRELDEAAVRAVGERLGAERVGAVAIGFMHAYAWPHHEQRAAEILRAQLGADVTICLSSEVCPEIREYERFSTTCANAYVRPMMQGYLLRLRAELDALGMKCPLLLMMSGGGLTTLEIAARFPVRLVESGPAGGALLSSWIARERALERVLSFDMGGTTAKICLIDQGEPERARTFEVARAYRNVKGSGLPVRVPVIEMVEIGAGGGSIARVDRMQRITVGPDSAGADPGPASYGRGRARDRDARGRAARARGAVARGGRVRDRRGEHGQRRPRARDRARPSDRALHDDRVRGRRAAARGPARRKARGCPCRRARRRERRLGDRLPAGAGLVPGRAQSSRDPVRVRRRRREPAARRLRGHRDGGRAPGGARGRPHDPARRRRPLHRPGPRAAAGIARGRASRRGRAPSARGVRTAVRLDLRRDDARPGRRVRHLVGDGLGAVRHAAPRQGGAEARGAGAASTPQRLRTRARPHGRLRRVPAGRSRARRRAHRAGADRGRPDHDRRAGELHALRGQRGVPRHGKHGEPR